MYTLRGCSREIRSVVIATARSFRRSLATIQGLTELKYRATLPFRFYFPLSGGCEFDLRLRQKLFCINVVIGNLNYSSFPNLSKIIPLATYLLLLFLSQSLYSRKFCELSILCSYQLDHYPGFNIVNQTTLMTLRSFARNIVSSIVCVMMVISLSCRAKRPR